MGNSYRFLVFFILACLFPGVSSFGADEDVINYFRTDSAYVYNWNSADSTWIPGSYQRFYYDNGRLLNIVTYDYYTHQQTARLEYSYNTEGLLEMLMNYVYSSSSVAINRNLYYYNSLGQYTEIHIQKQVNSEWVDDRIQMNYIYNDQGQQAQFQMIYWRNGAWTLPTTDYSFYNENGQLVKREAIRPTGVTDYQVIYNYNEIDQLSESFAQYPGTTGWLNWWFVNYQYDDCGFKVSQVQSTGSGTEWLPNTKVVNYSYFKPELYPYPTVPVCHYGSTMYVIKKILKRHLAHGDCLGTCPETKKSESDLKGAATNMLSDVPFTVYPNPASDRITVVRNGYDTGISKVDIMDMNGNLLRSVTVTDSGEVTIERGVLISGQYILRIHGEQIYSLIVVFN